MKTPWSSTELRLPDFNPSKSDVDARSWMSTADLCVNDENLQGARLMVALSRALKAKTAVTGFLCQGQGHYASSIRMPKASQTGPGCCQWRSEWIRCSQGEEGQSMRSERACWDVALIW
ncbi:uncharacterized protein LOC125489021 [Plutella xylostella]|uniref:uncharacterized protein LOC125489021 n=1 Tax=Plutella xylostella TaxID=51655 RepID=UPI002032FF02|nr:uncharacterized protein LOC125489021 [Plutella xylostella]